MPDKKTELLRVSTSQKRALAIATIAAIVIGILFLRHYLMLVTIAAIVAFLFQPVYKWLLVRGYKEGTATMLTFLATLLSVIIPLAFVVLITIGQLTHLSKSISSGSLHINASEIGNQVLSSINDMLASLGLNYQLSSATVAASLTQFAQEMSTAVLQYLASSITSIFSIITSVIIYIYVFFSLLRNKQAVIDTLSALNPLGENITDLYLKRMGSMTKAMVRGQFIIAVMQGLVSALGLYIVGFHSLFFFFFLLLTVLSFIPLGAGIVTIPIGIILILFGDVWQGVFLIANHLIIVTNIDNVMRPRLVPRDARLDPALAILSVFAGLGLFGFFGIIIGPVLMIVIVTTIQMFLEVYRDVSALDDVKPSKANKLLGRLNIFNRRKKA